MGWGVVALDLGAIDMLSTFILEAEKQRNFNISERLSLMDKEDRSKLWGLFYLLRQSQVYFHLEILLGDKEKLLPFKYGKSNPKYWSSFVYQNAI